jgi:hypothetical protein
VAVFFFWDVLVCEVLVHQSTLKIEAAGSSEILVHLHQNIRFLISEIAIFRALLCRRSAQRTWGSVSIFCLKFWKWLKSIRFILHFTAFNIIQGDSGGNVIILRGDGIRRFEKRNKSLYQYMSNSELNCLKLQIQSLWMVLKNRNYVILILIHFLNEFVTVHNKCWQIPPPASTHFATRVHSELIFTFLYAGSRIQNVTEQFVWCIHLYLV